MRRTRLSLAYPTCYLITTGLGLVIAPDFVLHLLFSNGSYGEIMPRMAGTVVLGLGILVAQIGWFQIEKLYTTLIWVRVFFCAMWIVLWRVSGDPFFLVVFGVVFAGLVATSVSHLVDRRAART